jgi:hypothetical protein
MRDIRGLGARLHLSRRDLVLQSPANDGDILAAISHSPNPIGTAIALVQRIDGGTVCAAALIASTRRPSSSSLTERCSHRSRRQARDFQIGET